ncbi:MAG TPA: NADH-quinone oxidoreductase subunit C [Anaeromyxobacteraceae bacterium]|nr:NADH-quinone oxidoreductase subunit C [Anaeromyxobacteraceae bacterium]
MAKSVLTALVARFPGDVYDPYEGVGGDDCVFVRPSAIVEVCRFLKSDPAMAMNLAPYITAVDYLGLDPRFELVYNLVSTVHRHRVRLRVKVPESALEVPSVTGVWKGADWFERYCFDMYGIRFKGHPDLRRLLMYDEFVGHPLRKDYPLRGRQPLVPEREVKDIYRGPGPAGRD